MRKWGCLLSWIVLIVFVSGVYAFNDMFDSDVRKRMGI